MVNPILKVTPAAADQVRNLMKVRASPCLGVRIGTKTKGCNGMTYTMEFAEKPREYEEIIDLGDIKILIDPKAIMFLMGTEMDYKETDLESGFVFNNPNEKGRCGCGESFHV